jgi:hypothetical protein
MCLLSSVARDSTMAVYAADSAIQCAVDAYNNHILVVEDAGGVPQNGRIKCVDSSPGYDFITITDLSSSYDQGMNLEDGNYMGKDYYIYQSDFPAQINFSNDTCAKITVTTGFDLSTHKHKTIIDSRGYNFRDYYPCLDDGEVNSRSVERAIRLQYFD